MDYHPKNVLITCIFLSCKVEEFNVSLDQFVGNVKGDQSRAAKIVLNTELLLMQQLKYHLTVHNPYRSIEGFLIDIKVTNCNQQIDSILKQTSYPDARLDVGLNKGETVVVALLI